MIVLMLFWGDEQAVAALPREERNGLVERHVHYNHEVLEKRVKVLATRGLDPAGSAVTVRPAGADRVVTPGTYVGGRDVVGGFYLIECASFEEAVELAKAYPMPDGLGGIEVRPVVQSWDYAPSVDVDAPADLVWPLYAEPGRWPSWMHDVEAAALDGPLAAGTNGTLAVRGLPPMPLRVTAVEGGRSWTSETEVAPGVRLTVAHTLSPLPDGRTRVVHQVTMPRAALDHYGLDFSPRFNAGLRSGLDSLAAAAAELARPTEEVAR